MRESDKYIQDFISKLNKEQKLDHDQIALYTKLSNELEDKISQRSLMLNKLQELLND